MGRGHLFDYWMKEWDLGPISGPSRETSQSVQKITTQARPSDREQRDSVPYSLKIMHTSSQMWLPISRQDPPPHCLTPRKLSVQETLRNSAKPTKYVGQHSALQAIALSLTLLVCFYCSRVNYACLLYQDLCVSSELC